jgi:ABC-2 type transport system ATP-binding protein
MQKEIVLEELKKVYNVPLRKPGLVQSIKSIIHPQYMDVLAVDNISFDINPGEIVGFIGPNGAGKTTTLKMLCGLLYPTSGSASVAGFIPWERKIEFLRNISMVLGNKSQLTWENTVLDCFYILKEIYRVADKDFKSRFDELVPLLDIEELLPKLTRNLSLGERAKCEFIAAILHNPRVLFLDEPTLGLDVSMQFRLRNFISEYNRRYGTTVILTSHYMADIVTLCKRVILIYKGKLLFDGNLSDLAVKIAPFKLIRMNIARENSKKTDELLSGIKEKVTVISQNERNISLRVKNKDLSFISSTIINNIPLTDLSIEDPPIEAVIDQVYREGVQS